MSENVSQIAECIEKNIRLLPFLRREGFSAKHVVIQPGFGSIPDSFSFNLERHQRRLSVGFMPDSNLIGVFVVGIHRTEDSEIFDLMDWRLEKGVDQNDDSVKLSSYSGTMEEKVKGFCAFLDKALQDPAILKILRGEAWESTPFDFGDYK